MINLAPIGHPRTWVNESLIKAINVVLNPKNHWIVLGTLQDGGTVTSPEDMFNTEEGARFAARQLVLQINGEN